MAMNNAFYKHSDVDRLYILKQKGGKGMINIKDYLQRISWLHIKVQDCSGKSYQTPLYAEKRRNSTITKKEYH